MKKRDNFPVPLTGIINNSEPFRQLTNIWFGSDGGVETRAGLTEIIWPRPIIIQQIALPDGKVGSAYTPTTLTVRSGTGTGTMTWSAEFLPTGLSIGASTGTISGTPTTSGSYNAIRIRVTDSDGRYDIMNAYMWVDIADAGLNWTALTHPESLASGIADYFEPSSNVLLCGTIGANTGSYNPAKVFRSVDGGSSWTEMVMSGGWGTGLSGLYQPYIQGFIRHHSNSAILCTKSGVWPRILRSTDDGANWSTVWELSHSDPDYYYKSNLSKIFYIHGYYIVLLGYHADSGTKNTYFLWSSDGITWTIDVTSKFTAFPTAGWHDLLIANGTDTFYGRTFYNSGSGYSNMYVGKCTASLTGTHSTMFTGSDDSTIVDWYPRLSLLSTVTMDSGKILFCDGRQLVVSSADKTSFAVQSATLPTSANNQRIVGIGKDNNVVIIGYSTGKRTMDEFATATVDATGLTNSRTPMVVYKTSTGVLYLGTYLGATPGALTACFRSDG